MGLAQVSHGGGEGREGGGDGRDAGAGMVGARCEQGDHAARGAQRGAGVGAGGDAPVHVSPGAVERRGGVGDRTTCIAFQTGSGGSGQGVGGGPGGVGRGVGIGPGLRR